jgi:hypothetical protein
LHDGEPIFALVDIKKTKLYDEDLADWRHTFAGETQGGAYNAHPQVQKENAWGWAMPFIAKEQEGVTSRIAIRNNSNCNKINGHILIKDETGTTVTTISVPWLHPKHMKVFDLANFEQLAHGFAGSAEFWVDDLEQLCDRDDDGHSDIEPVMPSVVVLNYGWGRELTTPPPIINEGDLTRVYEGIPFYTNYSPCTITISGQVVDEDTLQPIVGASISVFAQEYATTDSRGHYSFQYHKTAQPMAIMLRASKPGYVEGSEPLKDVRCEDHRVNFELQR